MQRRDEHGPIGHQGQPQAGGGIEVRDEKHSVVPVPVLAQVVEERRAHRALFHHPSLLDLGRDDVVRFEHVFVEAVEGGNVALHGYREPQYAHRSVTVAAGRIVGGPGHVVECRGGQHGYLVVLRQ